MEQAIIKKRVIGVDISLEETTYAIVNAKGEILVKDSFPTENYPDANDYIGTLSERILMMIEENGGYESIRSVGVSCPSANFSTFLSNVDGAWISDLTISLMMLSSFCTFV